MIEDTLRYLLERPELVLATGILIAGLILGYTAGKLSRKALERFGLDEAMKGTEFERTLQNVGLSTIGLFSKLSSWFIYAFTIYLSIDIGGELRQIAIWSQLFNALPRFFLAALAFLIGVVIANKTTIVVQDRLQQFKLPKQVLLPEVIRYSIIYIAALIALGQLGLETQALIVLLVIYMFGIILLLAIAGRRPLAAGAAGLYLIMVEPYSIGDNITVGQHSGVVQEITLLFTYIEGKDTEYILPNHLIFDEGIVRETTN